ncbi:rab-like protein 3 [Drosophila pseudoobscura]|uniref:Rab-like protein 3 n=1 Tax=Drosophila pseudoobscura pseudoobscura TaxID=46245 RepID=A0A6I8V125_DROPS|nr:rab-like protein 3 [Drosophila pseudoobscura]
MKYFQQDLQRPKNLATFRILILGDPGVGKTCLSNLLANSPMTPTRSSRTVSDSEWTVQVRLHDYNPIWGTEGPEELEEPPDASGAVHFVEFYDMNRAANECRGARKHLYRKMDGIVLVYNLQDMETQDNLHDWMYGPLVEISQQRKHKRLLSSHHVPILVVGTMLDRLAEGPPNRRGGIAHQLGAEEVLINCLDPHALAKGTRNLAKVSHFLNSSVDWMREPE